MKIAIPTVAGRLAAHFGHCEEFTLIEVDWEQKKILGRESFSAPPHEPGLLPRWLAGKGADMIIAGGMGSRAQDLFMENQIRIMTGAPPAEPMSLVESLLAGGLKTGRNLCDH